VEARKIELEVELRKRDGFDYPVIYKGRRDHEARYMKQHKFMQSRLVWQSPWEEVDESYQLGDELESHMRRMEGLAAHPMRVVKSVSVARDAVHPCEFNCCKLMHFLLTWRLQMLVWVSTPKPFRGIHVVKGIKLFQGQGKPKK
jgi:hypothetical protein